MHNFFWNFQTFLKKKKFPLKIKLFFQNVQKILKKIMHIAKILWNLGKII